MTVDPDARLRPLDEGVASRESAPSGTINRPGGRVGAAPWSLGKRCQSSARSWPCLMSSAMGHLPGHLLLAIEVLRERRATHTLHGVDETLARPALRKVGLDQRGERRRDGGADDDAESDPPALLAAKTDLEMGLSVFIDATDANVTDVVVRAGVDAAREVECERTDLAQIVLVVEASLNGIGDGGVSVLARSQ